jgi:hypothetical protein
VAENTAERLAVLERSQDGFEIAEADLRIRGPGELLGSRSRGALPFKMADLVRRREWLLKAREDVLELLKSDPQLEKVASRPPGVPAPGGQASARKPQNLLKSSKINIINLTIPSTSVYFDTIILRRAIL